MLSIKRYSIGSIALQLYKIKYAGVAQSVEQRIRNAQVGGSSPFTSSIKCEQSDLDIRLFFCLLSKKLTNHPFRFFNKKMRIY